MRTLCLLAALLSLVLVASSRLNAQVPFTACTDRQLRPIAGRVDNDIAAGAVATMENGARVILWNQHSLGQTTSTYQLFVYLHECAHHNLNHIFKLEGRSIEDQADCWAYQLLVDGGMVNGSHLDELTRDLRRSPGDINHLGGEALLGWLKECLELRTSQTAWSNALSTLNSSAAGKFQSLRGQPIPDGTPGSLEVTEGTPGTFDCELIAPPAVRCMVFVTRKQKAAEKRFDALVGIIARWLPSGWSVLPPSSGDGTLARSYVARDSKIGTLLVLGLTPQSRIYFLMKAPA